MSDLSNRPISNAAGPLTRRQKAAVIVHLLISGGVDPGLRDMPADQQRAIVREMARLRFVDRETLAAVVGEFATELDSIGLHFPRDMGKVIAALEHRLSLDVVEGLTAELGPGAASGDGPWVIVGGLDIDTILHLADGESDEVCAIMLSKLPAGRAAEVMARLPAGRAQAVAAAFARTEDVPPAAVARIGMAFGRQTANRTGPAFETGSALRVGNILNAATSAVRRAILDSLDGSDADFAARVRATIFSYENIPDRIDPRDLPKVLRGVDPKQLVTALAGTPPEMEAVKAFVLGSISSRLADQIRDEIEEAGGPPPAEEAEAAMSAIVARIREMEEAGELTLLVPPGA